MGAGKTTLAREAASQVRSAGTQVLMLDGDELRAALGDVGFDKAGRMQQSARAAALAVLASKSQISTIVALISPYRQARTLARQAVERRGGRFIEVFVDTPLPTCRARRPDVYSLKQVSGVDDPYEVPLLPDMVVRPDQFEWAVDQISSWLKTK